MSYHRSIFFHLFLLSLIFPLKSQPIQFYKEDIDFIIEDEYFIVKGFYYFCNVSDKIISMTLYYPFPTDSDYYGNIDSILVEQDDSIVPSYFRDNSGIYFNIKINAYSANKYFVSYRQKLLKNKAEYILVTTNKWNRPLERGNYRLTLPNDLKILYLSYEPDSIKIGKNQTIYYFQKLDFIPQKNFVFEVVKNYTFLIIPLLGLGCTIY
jgi:hypothetical protein